MPSPTTKSGRQVQEAPRRWLLSKAPPIWDIPAARAGFANGRFCQSLFLDLLGEIASISKLYAAMVHAGVRVAHHFFQWSSRNPWKHTESPSSSLCPRYNLANHWFKKVRRSSHFPSVYRILKVRPCLGIHTASRLSGKQTLIG